MYSGMQQGSVAPAETPGSKRQTKLQTRANRGDPRVKRV